MARRVEPRPHPAGQRARAVVRPAGEVKVNLFVKYTMFLFNVLFWLCGAAILAFGVWGLLSKSGFSVETLADEIGLKLDPMYAFVIAGGVVFILGFLGCLGSLRENTLLLKSFSAILVIMFLSEIAIGVVCYFFQDRLVGVINSTLEKTIIDYFDDADSQFLFDTIQENLRCCGSLQPEDWELNVYFNCSSIAHSRCSVSFSCCLQDPTDTVHVINYQCGYGVLALPEVDRDLVIHTTGCVAAMKSWLSTNIIWLGCFGGALILLQMFAIGMAKSLVGSIEEVKSHWQR